MLTVTSPPLKGAGGMFTIFFLLFKIIVVLLPNFNENYIWQFTKRTTTDLIDTKTPSS